MENVTERGRLVVVVVRSEGKICAGGVVGWGMMVVDGL